MATTPWYDYPITNGHASDDGIDIGTGNDVPLTFPAAGQVIDASYHVYGGQVVVHMPNGYDEYFIHLDKIFVHPGDSVSPDEVVGLSGGGVGDNVLHDGVVQPAQSQSWYEGHSSGRHTEFGEFKDTSAHGDMAQFNRGWGNKARQLDPTLLLMRLNEQGAPNALKWPAISGAASAVSGAVNAVTSGPGAWVDGAAKALGFTSPQNALQRLAVGGVGVLLMLGGVFIALQPEVQAAQAQATKAATTAAKVAAV